MAAPAIYSAMVATLVDLPDIVSARRERRQLSLREAAAEIGISHTTLARVEQGSTCSIENLIRILEWLG
jgi:transcriptional regulator with XRE-family HTH domain